MLKLLLLAAVIAAIIWALRGRWKPSRKDLELEARDARRDQLQAAMARLGPNAQSRLRELERLREAALQQLPEGSFRQRWTARLDELVEAGTQLLLMLDANRAQSPQRTAAVAQLDKIQDVMEALVRAPLEGRDPAVLDARLIELDALTGAARES